MSEFNPFKNSLPRILFIKHDEGGIGGTGIFTFSLASGLNNFNSIVAYPHLDSLVLEFYSAGKFSKRMLLTVNSDYTKEEIILDLISYFEIALVNIQHLIGFNLELISDIKQKGIPIVFNFNDLFFATGSLKYLAKGHVDYLSADKKDKMKSLLSQSDIKIFPSNFLLEKYQKLFKFSNPKVIPIGSTLHKHQNSFSTTDKVTIGFVGVASQQKGLESFLKLIKIFKKKINFIVLGVRGHNYDKFCRIYNLKEGHDFFRYEFNDSNIKEKIHKSEIDLIVFPSRIPESYSLTLSYAIQLSIPVIVFNTGAIAQRVKDYNAGWIFPTDKALSNIVENISKDKSLLSPVIKHLNTVQLPEFPETVKIYEQMFSSQIKNNIFENNTNIQNSNQYFEKIEKTLNTAKKTTDPNTNPFMLEDKNLPITFRIKRAIRRMPLVGKVIYKVYKWKR